MSGTENKTENKIETQEQAVKLVQDVATQAAEKAAEKAIAPLAESMAKLMEQTNKERDEKAIQEAVQKAVAETEAKHKAEMQAEADRREQAQIESQNKFVAPSGSDTNVGSELVKQLEQEKSSIENVIASEFKKYSSPTVDSYALMNAKNSGQVVLTTEDPSHEKYFYKDTGLFNVEKFTSNPTVDNALQFQSNDAQPKSSFSRTNIHYRIPKYKYELEPVQLDVIPKNPIYENTPQIRIQGIYPAISRRYDSAFGDFAKATTAQAIGEINKGVVNGELTDAAFKHFGLVQYQVGYSMTDLTKELIANGELQNYFPYILSKINEKIEVAKGFQLLQSGVFGFKAGQGNVSFYDKATKVQVDLGADINQNKDIVASILNSIVTVMNDRFIDTGNTRLYLSPYIKQLLTHPDYMNDKNGNRKTQYSEAIQSFALAMNSTADKVEIIDPLYTDPEILSSMSGAFSENSLGNQQLIINALESTYTSALPGIDGNGNAKLPYSKYFESNGLTLKSGTVIAVIHTPKAFQILNGATSASLHPTDYNDSIQYWTFKAKMNTGWIDGSYDPARSCFVLVAK